MKLNPITDRLLALFLTAAMIILFWLPLLRGARAAWDWKYSTIPDEYREYWEAVVAGSRAIIFGIPRKKNTDPMDDL